MDIETLRDLISCDPETGSLRWKERTAKYAASEGARRSWNAKYAGKPALRCEDTHGYLHGSLLGRSVFAHRVVWALSNGAWPSGQIDHINGNPKDNRIENLRDVSGRDNSKNRKLSRLNTSGMTGVQRSGKSWLAKVSDNDGKVITLGWYRTFDAACEARKAAERMMGYHYNHGRSCGEAA